MIEKLSNGGYIATFHGVPIYEIPMPRNDVLFFERVNAGLNERGLDVKLYSSLDLQRDVFKVMVYKDREKVFTFALPYGRFTEDEDEINTSIQFLIDKICLGVSGPVEETKEEKKPVILSLLKCKCCGGTIDLETLTCEFCNQKFYFKEE